MTRVQTAVVVRSLPPEAVRSANVRLSQRGCHSEEKHDVRFLVELNSGDFASQKKTTTTRVSVPNYFSFLGNLAKVEYEQRKPATCESSLMSAGVLQSRLE